MSDHITIFLPTDPRVVPSKKAQRDARALLQKLVPDAEDVSSAADEVVLFRNCGENFERALCPRCRADITPDTWQDWMSRDFSDEAGFRLDPIVTPCCSTTTTLNELVYERPQGFSRFASTPRTSQQMGWKRSRASFGRVRVQAAGDPADDLSEATSSRLTRASFRTTARLAPCAVAPEAQ